MIKYREGSLQKVKNAIDDTNKLLAVSVPQLIPYRKKDKWGFCDASKKIVIDCIYDEVEPFSEGLAAVRLNDKIGFININNEIVIPIKYERIVFCYDPHYDSGWNQILKMVFFNNRIRVVLNGLVGVIDKDNNLIVPFRYDWIGEGYLDGLKEKDIVFETQIEKIYKDYKIGLIDSAGNEILPCIYDTVSDFINGLAYVTKNNNKGCIDENGSIVIECIYDDIEDFNFGLAVVKKNGNYGCINRQGISILICDYDKIQIVNSNLIALQQARKYKWEYITVSDKPIFPFIHNNDYPFKNGIAKIMINGKYGLVNEDRSIRVECIYNDIQERHFFYDNLFKIQLKNKYGLMNNLGNIIFPCDYENLSIVKINLSSGDVISYVLVESNDNYGISDVNYKPIIPCEYDEIKVSNEGYFKVKKDEKWGLFLYNGLQIVPCDYAWIGGLHNYKVFEGNFATVYNNQKIGIFNREGKEILRCRYYKIGPFTEGLACVCRTPNNGEKYGYVNMNGKKVIPFIYAFLSNFRNGLAQVAINGKYGYINASADEFWED